MVLKKTRFLRSIAAILLLMLLVMVYSKVSAGTASFVGKTVKSDGSTALSGASIWIHTANYSYSHSQSSDVNGDFSFTSLDAGTYIADFTPPYNSEGLASPDSITFTVADGETVYYDGVNGDDCSGSPCSAITFVAAQNTISGTVSKTNGSPVTNATVEAYKDSGSGWVQASTNASGAYSLTVGAGTWNVMPRPVYGDDASQVDWTYTDMPTRVTFANNDAPGSTSTANFTVRYADCTVSGTVKDPNGNAIVNADQFVNVSAWSREGGGNSNTVASDGSFSFKVPSGSYNLEVYTWHTSYGSPPGSTFTVADTDGDSSCNGYSAGTIKLLAKNSTISGTVSDVNGSGVQNISVNAWKFNSNGWASATTGADGTYSLSLTSGTWMVSIMVDPCMSSDGCSSGTTYIYDGNPAQVTVADNATSSGNNFTVKEANSTINGRVVDSNGTALTTLQMGYAYVESSGGSGPGPSMFATIGAPVQNGAFALKVPAGTYSVNVTLGSDAGYCSSSSVSVTTTANSTSAVAITMTTADATISGFLKDGSDSGATIAGKRAEVFAHSGSVNYAYAQVDTSDGSYSLSVCPGDWYLGYWINSDEGYMPQPASNNKVTVVSGQTATKNIIVKNADATITGRVTAPDGSALRNTWVSVDTRSNDSAGSFDRDDYFFNGGITDSNGDYSIRVPSDSTYYIEAFTPPGFSYISPGRVAVTPATNETVTANLAFSNADVTLNGTVTQSGSGVQAFVTAWSESGGYSSTTSSSNGSYSMGLSSGTTWHIRALYESGTTYYYSDEATNSYGAGTATLNLDLSNSVTMPESASATFSASNQKTITLTNGVTVNIPAGALASSGNVTVTVDPKAEMPRQALASPITYGYDITALDSNGAEITSTFNSNVTITIPYTAADLASLGITEDELLAGYWDSSTNTWRNANNISVDKDNNTVTISINHFTDFSIFTAGKKASSTVTSSLSGTNKSSAPGTPEIYKGEGGTIEKHPIIAIVEPGTLPWDSYLKVTTYYKKHPLHFSFYWQVSDRYGVTHASFFNDGDIVPELQVYPTVLAFRYELSQLGKLPEKSLRIAQSKDEGKKWKILPTSVIDYQNKTVAALTKLDGQYMLVAGWGGSYSSYAPKKAEVVKGKSTQQKIIRQEKKQFKESGVKKTTSPTPQKPSFFQRIINFILRR